MSQLKIKEKKNHFAFLGNFITILILVVAIGVCAYAGGNLYKIFSEYKAGTDEYAKISDMVVTEKKADVKDETWVDKETKKILQGLFLLTVRTKGTWETAIPSFMDIT